MEKKGEKQKKKEEKRKSGFRFLRWGTPLPVVISVGIGVLLLSLPKDAMSTLSLAMGGIFCALSVLLLAFAFGGTRAGFVQLAVAAALIAFAVWLFVQPGEAVPVLLIVLTALLLSRGLFGVFYSLSAKKRGGSAWKFLLVSGLVLAMGAFVIFFLPIVSFDLQVALLGVLCLLDGGLELFSLFHRLTGRKKEPQKTEEKPKKAKEEQTPPEAEKTAEEGAEVPEKKKRKRFKKS